MKSFLRFLWRNRLYAAINLAGMTVALAFSIIILSYASAQYRTARRIPGWKDLYAVCYDNQAIMCYGMADALRNALPEAVSVSGFSAASDGVIAEYGGMKFNSAVMCADSTFFSMFDVDFKAGDAGASGGNNRIAISESFAGKIGRPGEYIIGKPVTLAGEDFTIGGIVADFKDGILPYTDIIADFGEDRFIGQYKSQPFSVFGNILTFVEIRDISDPDTLESKILDIYSDARGTSDSEDEYRFNLIRIDDLYFHPGNYFLNSGNSRTIRNMTLAGLALLISALFNYINLTVALSGKRAREMATRMLLGSGTGEIRRRYLKEALAFTSLCFILGILLAAAAVPAVNWLINDPASISETADMKVSDIFSPGPVLACAGIALLISVTTGLASAGIALRFSPSDIVKGRMRVRNRQLFSKVFIIIQNIIAIVLIALSITMELQMKHMLHRPAGCNLEDIYYLNTDLTGNDLTRFMARLQELPCTGEIGLATGLPGSIGSMYTSPDRSGKEITYSVMTCDTAVFNMLGFRIIEKYSDCMPGSVWVNESAARSAGICSGNTDLSTTVAYRWGDTGTGSTASGIVGDFIITGAMESEKFENAVIYIKGQEYFPFGNYVIRTVGGHAEAERMITDAYRDFCLETYGVEMSAWVNSYMTDRLSEDLEGARRNMRLMELFMIIAIMLSLAGLVAISIFYADSNSRSIALHKIYGGTTGSETWRNIRIYMLMSIAADAVAIPVAVSIASRYLEEFAYRISLEAWIFAVTVLLSLAITGLSTVWQIRKAARANPADALKSE